MNMVNDGNPTVIYVGENGVLTFDEPIRLSDGYFVLDDNLDLIQDWSII